MIRTVIGHFASGTEAQAVLRDLEQTGFTSDDVSYVAHDGSGRFAGVLSREKMRGSKAVTGTAVGSVSGLLAGLALLAIPGAGPVAAAGPIAAALAGASAGAAAGGLAGALGDMGVPDDEAKRWADSVHAGGTLVVVRTNDETEQRAVDTLKANGADVVARHDVGAQETGLEYDPRNPHSQDAANVGDEGGSTQWGQTVLRSDSDEPAPRTFSRDVGARKVD